MSYLEIDEQDQRSGKPKDQSDFKSLLFLLGHSKSERWRYITATLLIFLASIAAITSARWMGFLVDEGLLTKDWNTSVYWASGIFMLEGLSILATWRGRKMFAQSASRTILAIRQNLFEHLQALPISYYDRQPQGRIITRVTHDVEAIEEFFAASLGRLLNASMLATIAAIGMLLTHWRLGCLFLLSMLPAIIVIYLTRHRVRVVNRDMSRLSAMLNARLAEFLSGLPVIRSLGIEKWSQQRYDASVDEFLNAHLRANNLYAWSRPLIAFFCSLPLVILVGVAGQQIFAGLLGVGIFAAFIRYADLFFIPMQLLAREIHLIQQALTNSERISLFLQEKKEDVSLGRDGAIMDIQLRGEIEFKNIWMAYHDENWVLKNMSFKVKQGECVGLVGRTGSGKTSTVSLLSRLYPYQRGCILLDGQELTHYQRKFLRRSIGFVSQETILFRASLRANLMLGENFSANQIERAVEATGLAKIMKHTGMSLDSLVYEGGSNLSTGEHQLISMTRILLRNPTILILDEATANIDPEYEQIIQDSLKQVMQGRTTLIIAHRLHTLDICDRVLSFSHGELIKNNVSLTEDYLK